MNILKAIKNENKELFNNIESILKETDKTNLPQQTRKIYKILKTKEIGLYRKLYIKKVKSKKLYGFNDSNRVHYNPTQERVYFTAVSKVFELIISVDINTKEIYYLFDNGKVRVHDEEVVYTTKTICSQNILNEISVYIRGTIEKNIFNYQSISIRSDDTYDTSNEEKGNEIYKIANIIEKHNIKIEDFLLGKENESLKIDEILELEKLESDHSALLKEFLFDKAIFKCIDYKELKIKDTKLSIKENIKRKVALLNDGNKVDKYKWIYEYDMDN